VFAITNDLRRDFREKREFQFPDQSKRILGHTEIENPISIVSTQSSSFLETVQKYTKIYDSMKNDIVI